MRPTISLFSKALRHPLSSKRGNKDYYKGTRTGNVLLKKRMPYLSHGGTRIQLDAKGRERTWTMPKDRVDGSGRLDESKMTSFVVPPGLEGTQVSSIFEARRQDVSWSSLLCLTSTHNRYELPDG